MNPIYKFQLSANDETRPDNYFDKQLQIAQYDGKYILKSNGTLAASSVNVVAEFAITDTTKRYYANGRVGSSTTACFIAYYTSNGVFISYQFASTGTARVFNKQLLTVPANCRKIRVQGYNDGNGTVYLPQLFIGESRAFPIYKDDLAKDFEKESGQEFFRAKLSGKLTFESDDYTYIVSQAFDTQFVFDIFISYNAGQSWESYWRGTFWKTDCEFDADAQTVIVQPTVLDQYNDILVGMDKEYNLIELAPSMAQIQADKRPMVQVYVPGQSVIGCFLSGMWWEQDCDPVSDSEMVDIGGGALGRKLEYYYHFSLNKGYTFIEISGTMSPQLPESVSNAVNGQSGKYFEFYVDGVKYYRVVDTNFDSVGIYDSNTGAAWRNDSVNRDLTGKYSVTLYPLSGTGATGNVELTIETKDTYARFICDTLQVGGNNTYEIPADDIVENNRNYHRVIGYYFPDTIIFSTVLVSTPTQWGLYQPGQYYFNPADIPSAGLGEAFPVARNAWSRVSIWFVFSLLNRIVEESGRQQFTIRHAYPLWAVLKVLLAQIAPNIDFRANYQCSQFLYPYDVNPISGYDFGLFITPKSNIVTAGYDQPAQKAPITLRNVFDMLRDCFRCYWFVDDNNHLHIEHIQYFRNGGSYDGSPVVGIDLTTQQVPRNGKPWAFARDQFKFDKPAMAARYQFGWMDDVTQLFDGFPIDIISKYVNPDNIEQIDISRFTSDIDYILLNPSAVSKDGFVLLGAINQNGGYALPYVNFQIDNNDHILQNAYVAFCLLQQYYAYDMPAPNYEINGVQMVAQGIKKLKNQSIRFPVLTDPDLVELVKTNLGNGVIEKLSVNLSSRNANATLKYDTE